MPTARVRRPDRRGTFDEAMDLVARVQVGHLATITDDGYPYVIPVYHAVLGGRVMFHSGPAGQKLANIARDSRVCFEVAQVAGLVPNDKLCDWDAKYESAVVFGCAEVVTDPEAKIAALQAIARKYAGAAADYSTIRNLAAVTIVAITVEAASCKKCRPAESRKS